MKQLNVFIANENDCLQNNPITRQLRSREKIFLIHEHVHERIVKSFLLLSQKHWPMQITSNWGCLASTIDTKSTFQWTNLEKKHEFVSIGYFCIFELIDFSNGRVENYESPRRSLECIKELQKFKLIDEQTMNRWQRTKRKNKRADGKKMEIKCKRKHGNDKHEGSLLDHARNQCPSSSTKKPTTLVSLFSFDLSVSFLYAYNLSILFSPLGIFCHGYTPWLNSK